jgi:hypothetical protein
VEREEAKVVVVEASLAPPLSSTTLPLLGKDFVPLWDTAYSDVPLEPSLLAELRLIIGTPSLIAD